MLVFLNFAWYFGCVVICTLLSSHIRRSHWDCFIQRLRLLIANSSAMRSSKDITPEALLQLTSLRVLSRKCKTSSQKQFHAVIASGSLASSASQGNGTSRSALWLPFDLFLEDTMDGSQVAPTSAVEVLTGLAKALQAVNQTTWQETFLGLWIAALRLVQRERDPSEGPVPRLDTCLCMLLSVTTLAIFMIIEEEETALNNEAECSTTSQRKEKHVSGKRRMDLVSSLQQLGDYEDLLAPPIPVISVANQAAAKAMMFLSGLTVGTGGYLDGMSLNDMPVNCSGNMRHLIVEACIARNLLDTSAYLWPGYVKGRSNQIPRSTAGQLPGWSSLMKGSSLTPPMEHTVLLITKLLSPPVPANYSGSESHLIGYAPFLNVLLVGISSIDCVQIFSVHGVAPQLAGALMPICEVFGSCAPMVAWNLTTGEEISAHAVFSNAFTLLLKLWRFDRPPLEHINGDVAPVGSRMTPEYLLLVRNAQLASYANTPRDQHRSMRVSKFASPPSTDPIFMDSFPKLKCWYRQHQECIASILSGLIHGSPVHQIVDGLLNMMFRKVTRGCQPLTPTTSGSSNSSGSGMEDASLRLKLPAWDILEAVPFVLDASLTACANGRLSPRELVTG
ncbi:hypothetical protein U1Q18_034165 [Sarracenia purpurea var. burkii]